MMVIDIAVPRDAEPAIGDFDGVYLFDIDDLEKVVAREPRRAREGRRARGRRSSSTRPVSSSTGCAAQGVVPTIRALREQVRAGRRRRGPEGARRSSRRKEHSPAQQREVVQRAGPARRQQAAPPADARRSARPTPDEAALARRGAVRAVRARARRDTARDSQPVLPVAEPCAPNRPRGSHPRDPHASPSPPAAARSRSGRPSTRKARLAARCDPRIDVAFNVIKTQGDKILDVPLAKVGGKGLFVKEIEQALIDRTGDIAVHSMKDVPGRARAGPRARRGLDARGAVGRAVCPRAGHRSHTLPHGASVGTSSMRRQCQLLAAPPRSEDRAAARQRADAHPQARRRRVRRDRARGRRPHPARHGRPHHAAVAARAVSIPAVAQGVLGLETRADDTATIDLLRRAIARPRRGAADRRRARVPRSDGRQLPDAARGARDRSRRRAAHHRHVRHAGRLEILRAEVEGAVEDAEPLGERLADELLAQGADAILAATK